MVQDSNRCIHMRATPPMSAKAETGLKDSARSNDRIEQTTASKSATIHFGVFALLLAVTLPPLLESFAPTGDPLDASWEWIMGYAFQHHLQWGKAVLFTYGPLGFLANPCFYSDHLLWFVSATAHLVAWTGFGLTFGYILSRLTGSGKPIPRVTITAALAWVLV